MARAAKIVETSYDVFARDCPARGVFDRLTDKWALLVIGKLRGGTVRFNQMRREVDGVSQKVLSQTLKKLERDGIVQRVVYATVPVTVEYSLTPLGKSLSDVIEPLCDWAEQNIRAVHAAQRRYDAKHGALE